MKRGCVFCLIALVAGVLLLLVAAVVVVWLALGGDGPPEYQAVLDIPPQQAAQSGAELQRQVTQLRREVQTDDRWEMTFTELQINGWLINELPRRCPEIKDSPLVDPRVVILSDRQVLLAGRIRDERLDSVFALYVEPYLTDEPNLVGLRLVGASVGDLPIPLDRAVGYIDEMTANTDLPARWTTREDRPALLIRLPDKFDPRSRRLIRLELFHIEEDSVTLSGSARNEASDR